MELNPFSHEFHEDPYPVYRHLRDHAPCYHNEAQDWYALVALRRRARGIATAAALQLR